jgi:hypothetical protein
VVVAGPEGPTDRVGLVKMLHRCGQQAGLPGLYPHQLRHTFGHEGLAQGGGETDLTRLPAGSPARCCSATTPRPPTPVPGRHTAASRQATGHRRCVPLGLHGRASAFVDGPPR